MAEKSKSSPGGSTETKVDTKVREFTDAQGKNATYVLESLKLATYKNAK